MRCLLIILILYSCSFKSNIVAQDKCETLSAILNEEHIKKYIDSFESGSLIRVIDLSEYFGKLKCGHEEYSVRVENKLKVDLNSGRYIDISILSVEEENEITKVEVFYCKRSNECQRDFLMKGFVTFSSTNNGLKIKESKFGSID